MWNNPMGRQTIIVGIISFVAPLILRYILKHTVPDKRKQRKIWLGGALLYAAFIAYLTLGTRSPKQSREVNLQVLWSYASFYKADIRWQIYMNIFLFVPLGFFFERFFQKKWWKCIGIGFLLSTIVEACQYIFALGLCEIDDIINNTLGTMIGYLYSFLCKQICLFAERLSKGLSRLE